MAKKPGNKKSIAKAKKIKPAKVRTKTKTRAKARSKSLAKKKPIRKLRRTPTPNGITERVTNAFHAVVDTIKEAEALRHKMLPPGGSET